MKRGAGFLAFFAFLITGLHFAGGPATMKEMPEAVAVRTGATPKPVTLATTVCNAFESPAPGAPQDPDALQNPNENGEIARLIDRFIYGSAQKQRATPGPLPRGIRLMIVTIPDPRHTHLSLQFDRTLEAIQQAAQDERYTYDSSWLPWKTERVEYSSLSDRNSEMKEAAEREVCPGLVLFRRSVSGKPPQDCTDDSGAVPPSPDVPYKCGLFVFVVGEEPTAGLNRVQWDNALHWIDRHADQNRPDKTLRVLGPNFSGSMPSFVRALKDTDMYAGTFSNTLLYAGRIRGCSSWQWLKRQVNPQSGIKLPIHIADFEENDALQTDRLFQYLRERGHRLSEVAILSEDETAYGGLPDAGGRGAQSDALSKDPSPDDMHCNPEYEQDDRPVHLYYPRDISAIRSAYQEQSIFSQGSKGGAEGSAPATVLRPESGSGVQEETDTIAPFSGNNLALTQEAQLYGIVNTLKTHGIRFLVLRSTNSLDYLFLVRFMHRAYPAAYIVTMGSDLLFAREVDSTEFRGVSALSTFPLLPRGQDWTRQVPYVPQHAHRVFGAYTMEGVYVAARFVITDGGACPGDNQSAASFKHCPKPDIPDYAHPFWESMTGDTTQAEPATWLAVIGREGYWPLATLTRTLKEAHPSSSLAAVEKNTDQVHWQKLSLSASWRFLSVLSVLLLGMHAFASRYGWKRQDMGMFVQFTRYPGRRGPGLMAAGWGALCCVLLILFLPALRIFLYLALGDQVWVVVMGLGIAAASALATIELRRWSAPQADDPADTNRRLWQRDYRLILACMFSGIALFALAGALTFELLSLSPNGIITAYRSIHLTSGVSPLLSMLVLLAGLYWWFWQTLAGMALLGRGRPVLPRSAAEREAHRPNQMAEFIEQAALPFPRFGTSTLLLYLLPLLVVLLLAIMLQRAWMQAFDLVLHSLENIAFNRTLHLLIGVELYLILLECIQLYSTWQVLKRLLVALDRLPLRRTFAAMQGLSMRSLWRLSGTSSRARSRIFSRQLESLSHLGNELDAFEWRRCGSPALREQVRTAWEEGQSFAERRNEGRDFAILNNTDARRNRLTFRACAETITDELLAPEWRQERCSLEVQDAPVGGETHERIELSGNMPVRAGEEFVCLIYVGYLQNLLGRMRTMVLSIAGLFAAIALSMGVYPYTPRPTISLSLLVLLLAIATVVGLVFAGLDRDSTLSHITNTEPGSLGSTFWLRMVSFIGVPALGLIVAQFPEITDFVFSWIEPTMSAMK